MKKIMVSGGHPAPALAVIDELQEANRFDIVFVGRKYAVDSERTLSFEYRECQKRNIRFVQLQAGKLSRIASHSSLVSFLRIPFGFIAAFFIILIERPALLMSFGGYIALPLAFWSKLLGIPVFTHEQTMRAGSANKWIATFSNRVFTAFEDSVHAFPESKTYWIGNPVRRCVFQQNKPSFLIDTSCPILYVTGGSLGSHSINQHIFSIIEKLTEQFTVVHQIGEIKEYGDEHQAKRIRRSIDKKYKNRYIPVSHISEHDIGMLYASVDLVIGRAGANTFFELIGTKCPAILIPLPWSANGEQKAHAQFFEDHHIGVKFDQQKSSRELLDAIDEMHTHRATYKKQFDQLPLQFKHDAAQTLVAEIDRTV